MCYNVHPIELDQELRFSVEELRASCGGSLVIAGHVYRCLNIPTQPDGGLGWIVYYPLTENGRNVAIDLARELANPL